MARAIDVGTCFLVGAYKENSEDVFTIGRNAFFSMPSEDFADEMLKRAGAYFITRGDRFYVVGEDALKFSVITGNQDDYRRPMARGVLNPGEEEAVAMIEVLIEGIIGEASFKDEPLAVTVPAEPIDADFDTTFHRMVLDRFLKKLGYKVNFISEALSIIYNENPTVEVNGEEIPFTGIGMSFGAGMVNIALAWRAKKLLDFSCSRGGDWIDVEVSRVTSMPTSKVIAYKEKSLDLGNVDSSNRMAVALEIYYEELIRYSLEMFSNEFKRKNTAVEEPMVIAIAGGASKPPGFIPLFEKVLKETHLPIPILEVRHAEDPLTSVASGALIAAESEEAKMESAAAEPAEEPETPEEPEPPTAPEPPAEE